MLRSLLWGRIARGCAQHSPLSRTAAAAFPSALSPLAPPASCSSSCASSSSPSSSCSSFSSSPSSSSASSPPSPSANFSSSSRPHGTTSSSRLSRAFAPPSAPPLAPPPAGAFFSLGHSSPLAPLLPLTRSPLHRRCMSSLPPDEYGVGGPSDNVPPAAPLPSSYIEQLPLDPVVKVYANLAQPNYFLPWQMKASHQGTGSGFVIEGKRILTNAHIVADQKLVVLRKFGSATKYPAKVEAVGHDCDLALLSVADPEFWEGLYPLELGDVPDLQAECDVIGYPTGGDNISVTHGVVSRIELQPYAHGSSNLLAIQIDAAINPGNSGGPAVRNGKVAGVAFQNLHGAQNIGFIIPVPVIEHFLKDAEENKPNYAGFGFLGILCQPMENPQMREYFKMDSHHSGVLVTYVFPVSRAEGVLKENDILMKVDDIEIANDGTIAFRDRERIFFNYLWTKRYMGDVCTATILRDGQEMKLEVEVGPVEQLVPAHSYDKYPSYCITGGLVFTTLSMPYLQEYGEDWFNSAPRKLMGTAMYGVMEKPDEEVVILSHVLSDEANMGYSNLSNLQLKKFNGENILNLRQLVTLMRNSKDDYFRFDLEEQTVIILDAKVVREGTPTILEKYSIPHALSADLRDE